MLCLYAHCGERILPLPFLGVTGHQRTPKTGEVAEVAPKPIIHHSLHSLNHPAISGSPTPKPSIGSGPTASGRYPHTTLPGHAFSPWSTDYGNRVSRSDPVLRTRTISYIRFGTLPAPPSVPKSYIIPFSDVQLRKDLYATDILPISPQLPSTLKPLLTSSLTPPVLRRISPI